MCLCTVTSLHKSLNRNFLGKEIKGGWWKEDMSRFAIHQSCLLLLIWSANAHIHEALTGFSTRQHTCIATQEEQKGSGSEWETLTTENKLTFMNMPSTTEAALIFIYLLLSICTIKKKKKLPLKRNEGTAGWFQTTWFEKNKTKKT